MTDSRVLHCKVTVFELSLVFCDIMICFFLARLLVILQCHHVSLLLRSITPSAEISSSLPSSRLLPIVLSSLVVIFN